MAVKSFKLTIQYDGTDFFGWQVQLEERTVQGELTRVLSRIMKADVKVTGAGRTDAGVHAIGQAASFSAETAMEPDEIVRAANSLLPPDAMVSAAEGVAAGFDARRDAVARTYLYRLAFTWDVFNRRFVHVVERDIDAGAMAVAAGALVGEHDFASFGNASEDFPDTVRLVSDVTVAPSAGGIDLLIRANAFLYRMARNMVGALVAVGRGEMTAEDVKRILEAKDRTILGPPAPPQGLYLEKVDY
ncbi:MAG: tRNA pseudouridine(38-40) synthase TruA [Candidatus Coatesbacteria bacterium]|nr:MAG: tRNA pseudouridine(38-40) synthase TruA [Candidatus Coatesbacteria bacterium]